MREYVEILEITYVDSNGNIRGRVFKHPFKRNKFISKESKELESKIRKFLNKEDKKWNKIK